MTDLDRIVCDPTICVGQPAIRGTRVLVLGYLAHGETTARIPKELPSFAEKTCVR